MFISGLETLRVKFNDLASPATATWTDVSAPTTSLTTLDPILFTDSDTGASRTNRTFISQLAGKVSLMAFTDDDGATWTPSQGFAINSGVDQQTLGGGPYAGNADGSLKGGAVQLPGLDAAARNDGRVLKVTSLKEKAAIDACRSRSTGLHLYAGSG